MLQSRLDKNENANQLFYFTKKSGHHLGVRAVADYHWRSQYADEDVGRVQSENPARSDFVFSKQHVGDRVRDREAPPALRADEGALAKPHFEQRLTAEIDLR